MTVPDDNELMRIRSDLLQLLSTVGTHRLAVRDSLCDALENGRMAAIYHALSAAEARLFEAFLVFPKLEATPA